MGKKRKVIAPVAICRVEVQGRTMSDMRSKAYSYAQDFFEFRPGEQFLRVQGTPTVVVADRARFGADNHRPECWKTTIEVALYDQDPDLQPDEDDEDPHGGD